MNNLSVCAFCIAEDWTLQTELESWSAALLTTTTTTTETGETQHAPLDDKASTRPEDDEDADSLHSLFHRSDTGADDGDLYLMGRVATAPNAPFRSQEIPDDLRAVETPVEQPADEHKEARHSVLDSCAVPFVAGSAGDIFDLLISSPEVPNAPDSGPAVCLPSSRVDACFPEQSQSNILEVDFDPLVGMEDVHYTSSGYYLTQDGGTCDFGLEDHAMEGKLQMIFMHSVPVSLTAVTG